MCQKNQTPKESLSKRAADRTATGTGLFAVAAPERGVLQYRVVMVPGLSYEETVKRGHLCVAFKWIADTLESYESLEKAVQAKSPCGNCGPDPAHPHCKNHCMCTAVGEDCFH